MKFWSLSPRIQLDDSFGNIILDEAQDIDGAFYNVLSNHSDRNIIVIGDSYQQLFGWRGAINSMLLFDKPSFPLSISYRFDQCIADHSNQLLSNHSNPPSDKIIGQSTHSSNVIFYKKDTLKDINTSVILTRTKSRIIDLAEAEVTRGHKVHVKTEFKMIKWMLNDIMKLKDNIFDTITHPYIQRCSSFYTLETELEDSPDPEVYFALNLFKKHGNRSVDIIDLIEKNNVPESDAIKMISTTHSIKGREWDNVVIADDYEYVLSRENADRDSELSILYVAITRAKKNVYIPESLSYLFK
nr:3'-5' exonuclease [Aeromonas salmonicida]